MRAVLRSSSVLSSPAVRPSGPGVEAAEQAHLALRKDLAEVLAARVVEDHRAHLFARDLFKKIHEGSLRFSGRGRVKKWIFH